MEALLGIGIPFAYLMLAGFVYPKFKRYYYDGPPNMGRPDAVCCAFFSSLLLPVFIPVAMGMWLSNRGSGNHQSRLERKQEKELSEARHEAELARIRRVAAEELDRELEIARRA